MGLKKHLKSSKSEGNCKTFMLAAEESSQRWPNTTKCCDIATTDNRLSADRSETDESGNDEYDSDAIDSEGEDDSNDVILAFINSDEEHVNERPNTTHRGR